MANPVQLLQRDNIGSWVLVETHLPGLPPQSVGILLIDQARDALHLRFRPRWWTGLVDDCEAEIWQELAGDLAQRAEEIGAKKLLEWLAHSVSHTIRIADPLTIHFRDAATTLDFLYSKNIVAARSTTDKGNHFPKTWIAATASLALSWQLVRLLSSPHSEIATNELVRLDRSGILPFAAAPYHPTFANLDSNWNSSSTGNRIMSRHRARRLFRLSSNVVPLILARHVETPDVPVPAIVIPTTTSSTLPISPLPPAIPKFAHRNRLIKGLAAIVAPFKLFASR